MSIIGGIDYRMAHPGTDRHGSLTAWCCNACRDSAYQACRQEEVDAVDSHPSARARIRLMAILASRDTPLTEEETSFLITGEGGAFPAYAITNYASLIHRFFYYVSNALWSDASGCLERARNWEDEEEEEDIDEEDDEDSIDESLMPYDADPFAFFDWDSRNRANALVFGVELEMEPQNPSAHGQQNIVRALGGNKGTEFLLKSDGSLSAGVELVTMPFTLAQHLDGSGVPWKKVLDSVQGIARSGTDTTACGIHIHINKKALSALTIGKMLVFLNDEKLSPLVTTIAQRASSGYARRSSKKLTDGTRSSENRYDIMNVSVRHPTCEIRMFRGNLTIERLYKNLEFCHALVQYCRQSSMRTLCEWGAFSQWLIAHRGQYQNLVRFLIDKKTVGFRQLAKDSRDGQIAIIDR